LGYRDYNRRRLLSASAMACLSVIKWRNACTRTDSPPRNFATIGCRFRHPRFAGPFRGRIDAAEPTGAENAALSRAGEARNLSLYARRPVEPRHLRSQAAARARQWQARSLPARPDLRRDVREWIDEAAMGLQTA